MTVSAIEEYPLSKIAISSLKWDQSNPNKPSKEQIAAIKKSFERFGFLVPIIINENCEIGDGEHRALIYKELGLQEIPAYIVPRINNDIERRLLRQTMNKLRGEHEIKLDADEIALIFQNDKLDNLAELIAQERESLENILTKHKGIQFQHEDNFDVDKALEDLVPETQLGDIWQLGQHRIICADCTDKQKIVRLVEKGHIELLLTDPPYGINIVNSSNVGITAELGFGKVGAKDLVPARNYKQIEGDNIDFEPESILGYGEIQIIFGANHFANKLPNNSHWIGWDKKAEIGADNNNFSDIELAWTNVQRKSCRLYRYLWSGLLREGNRKAELQERVHPTQKPVGLLTQIICDYSQENNIIFDPFLGSGSTLIACEQTNRICYGVEIEPHYVDVAVKRWEAYTGKSGQKVQ
jgi:DNA modification methylase